FRKAEIRFAAAIKVPPDPAEVRRHHAADGLGLYAILGLAIRAGICPAPVRARIRTFAGREKIRAQSWSTVFHSVHGRFHRAERSASKRLDGSVRRNRRP